MKYKRQITQLCISWGVLVAFMTTTRPSALSVALLIVPFVLLFWAFISLWNLLRILGTYYMGKDVGVKGNKLGSIVCICLVLLLILQSLGQLTLRDSITVVALAVIGYLYILRSQPRRSKK